MSELPGRPIVSNTVSDTVLDSDYLEALYELYLANPESVSSDWRTYFDSLPHQPGAPHRAKEQPHRPILDEFARYFEQTPVQRVLSRLPQVQSGTCTSDNSVQIRVLEWINAYRLRGHEWANTDPLGLRVKPEVRELTLSHHELNEVPSGQVFLTGSFRGCGGESATFSAIQSALERIYCGSVGFEYLHIMHTTEKEWLQERIETPAAFAWKPEEKKSIYHDLVAAEGLERYLHTQYVGQKRFSLEGGDALVPALKYLVQHAGSVQVTDVVLAMAHRGRLNVLVNVLGKPPRELFAEFSGKTADRGNSSGDVKYHMGYSSDVHTPGGVVHQSLAFNPSHLEVVAPVVQGSTRARQDKQEDADGSQVLPVVIHGDAAFSGQGVVMETLNMSQTRGYRTGGTVHIIINNQVGFTTHLPEDARSTLYCSDVAKMVEAPIFHVNADDPEAVVWVTQLALDFRMRFAKDVVIDLVCYRRHGHNEADEPAATQPLMYQVIRAKPTARALYALQLQAEQVCTEQETQDAVEQYRTLLEKGDPVLAQWCAEPPRPWADWSLYRDQNWDQPVRSSVTAEAVHRWADIFAKTVEAHNLQPQVAKVYRDRQQMMRGQLPMDWGCAENLAYASLLEAGYSVRISGQDCGRGTFAHRHAAISDQQTGEVFYPLKRMASKKARFTVIDSLLSEAAVLGFEYGYATASPETLVIWEAQFGDFANSAQVVIDQFISSGEQKWDRLCGLVLLLPHGYEGMGPEHSSARLERFLQLAAQDNMQICVPTQPAQIFHLLRRQMIRPYRKPLVVFSPKSLLRHRSAVSQVSDLTDGRFQCVIPEDPHRDAAAVRQVIVCSGKVYYDLQDALEKRQATTDKKDTAVIRVEQLYPFPEQALQRALAPYPHVERWVWCQEEPQNQGAWQFVQPYLSRAVPGASQPVNWEYAGRFSAASPAVGYYTVHLKEQQVFLEEALRGS